MNRHPGEGALLRLIDDNADARERAQVSQHVERCPECARRATELREIRSFLIEGLAAPAGAPDRVPSAFGTGPHSPNGRTATRRDALSSAARPRVAARVAIAAGLLLAFGLTATAAPVRAWLTNRLEALLGTHVEEAVAPRGGDAPTGAGEVPTTPAAATTTAPDFDRVQRGPPTFSLAFIPQSERFVVEVEHRQAAGSLHIAFGPGDAAVDTWGATPLRWVRVSPGQLRLRNAPASEADYRLHLPPSVSEVIVRIAGKEAGRLLLRPGESPPELTLDLSSEP